MRSSGMPASDMSEAALWRSMLGVHPSPSSAAVMISLNSVRTLGGSVGEPTALVNTRSSGLFHRFAASSCFGVLILTSAFEGVDDGGGCVEGADGSGGLGGADRDRATVAFASFADVDDAVVGVDVVPGQGGCFAGS